MIRSLVIHAELAQRLTALRHAETFVVCDAAFATGDLACVDLGLRYGLPSFADVVSTLLPAVVVQDAWVPAETVIENPEALDALRAQGIEPGVVGRDDFAHRVRDARFVVRTGEASLFATVVFQAGLGFAQSPPLALAIS